MSRTQVKSKPKSKGADSPHHRASQDAAGGYSVFCAPSSRLGAFYSAGPVFGLGAPIQAKVAIGRTNDPYEREADAVADRVTDGGQAPPISVISAGGLNDITQRQIEDEEQPEELTPVQTPLQRQETEEEEEPEETSAQPQLLQRQAVEEAEAEAEEEPAETLSTQTKLVQRQATEEEEPEETPAQPQLLQRQAVEEAEEKEEEEPAETLSAQTKLVQRQATEEEEPEELPQPLLIQRQPPDEEMEEEEPEETLSQPLLIQRQPLDEGMEEEELEEIPPQHTLQTQQVGNGGNSTPPSMQSAATRAIHNRGSGASINPTARHALESRIGIDFSSVRVHQDGASQATATDLKARAFTHKNHIWLGQGESQSDLKLMAHEVTHVIQQNADGVQRKPVPDIQRQEEAPATQEADDPVSQEFSFPTDEIENRLGSTPREGAVTPESDVELASQTESNLEEVESDAEEEQTPEEGDEGEEAAEENEEAEEDSAAEEASTLATETPGAVEPPGPAPPMPGSAAEYEGIVDDQVSQYLDENASPDSLSQLDQTTQALLEGASELSQRQVSEPEQGSLLGQLTGITPLVESFTRVSPGYEQEETWLQVVAQIRDITGTLGGVVGMIGLVATVSGLILSLLIPPVGAFLLTAGRFCDLAALILDAVSFALGIFLTAYNRYRLKNATDPEEKARLLALVRQDAMKTVMSGISVATAMAPGAARMLGNTRWGARASQRMSNIVTASAGRITGLGRRAAGSRLGQKISTSVIGRGARGVGGALGTAGRGIRTAGSEVLGTIHRGAERLRGTAFLQGINQRLARWGERAADVGMLQRLGQTGIGSRVSGAYRRNRELADVIRESSTRQHHVHMAPRMERRLGQLDSPAASIDDVRDQLSREFGVDPDDLLMHRDPGTNRLSFIRDENAARARMRREEFVRIQTIRDQHPSTINDEDLARLVNQHPGTMGNWTPDEMRAFNSLNPYDDIRTSRGAVRRSGKLPKTPHHTIPVSVAPHLQCDPRFIQIVNNPSICGYQEFLNTAYPPGDFPRLTTGPHLQDALRRGDIAGFDERHSSFFKSRRFVRQLQREGGTGVWINPLNRDQKFFFDPHLVVGHGWNWDPNESRIFRTIFGAIAERGDEPLQRFLGSLTRAGVRTGLPASIGAQESEGDIVDTVLERSGAQSMQTLGTQASSGPGVAETPPAYALPPSLSLSAGAAEFGTGESSEAFLAEIGSRMGQSIVSFGSFAAGVGTTAGSSSGAATSAMEMQEVPEAPLEAVPYSPASLAHIRESRISIVAAIEAVQAYITDTQQSEHDSELARQASEILVARNEEQQTAIEGERQDVASQQQDLDQAEGAQQEMTAEGDRASAESERGKSESEDVQSEGGDVSVEAKPEEPRKKSWLERAWDATAGAVWRRLVRPVIRAARRKVSQVMQGLNNFITDMINQALGLDDIEAEISAGGENIQERRAALQETDGGLDESNATAIEEQQQNEATVEQANNNIDEARTVRSDAEQLLAALVTHHDLLQEEENAAADYTGTFGAQYREFFEYEEAQAEEMETAEPRSEATSEEERVTSTHVMPVVSYIDALEDAEQRADQELAGVAGDSERSIPPDLRVEEREAAGIAQSQLGATRSAHSARLFALRSEAMECLGQPVSRGLIKLEQIVDEILVIAEELEQERIASLQTISDVHSQATMVGGASVAS